MFKFVIFIFFAITLTCAQDEQNEEVCLDIPDGEQVGVGQDLSCTQYWYCDQGIGYLEDCLDRSEDLEFDYEINDCNYNDVVQCAGDFPDPDPETEEPLPETPSPTPPVTQPTPTQPTTLDPSIPDIECPTDQPGKIIFFPSSNCSEYFICANGFRMKMVCMEGFTWNQQELQCDYPIFSRCSVSVFGLFRVLILIYNSTLAKYC